MLVGVKCGRPSGLTTSGRDTPLALEPAAVVANVGHHPGGHELGPDEVADQLAALLGRQFDRQRDHDLAGDLGVLAPLGRLDLVPEAGAVMHPGRRILRSQDLRAVHAAAALDLALETDLPIEAPLEVAHAFGLLDCDPDSAEALDVAGRPWLVLVFRFRHSG